MAIALEELLEAAVTKRAGSLLLLPGQLPVCRIGRELQPPLSQDIITPDDTRLLAGSLLTEAEKHVLERTGSIERPFSIGGAAGEVSVFLGQGSPHLVFYLQPAD